MQERYLGESEDEEEEDVSNEGLPDQDTHAANKGRGSPDK
jgi:hypothetical protein